MTPSPPPLRPGWALVGLGLATLMSSLDTSIANTALPALGAAFGASFQATQWVVLAYLLTLTSLLVSAGHLGDLLGRRRLLLAGLTTFLAASLLCGAAPSFGLLLAGRAVQGLGAAAMMALTVAAVGDVVPRERIGRAIGLLGTLSALGTALGPSLGGLLTTAFGWRALFLVNLPLGLANLILVHRALPPEPAGERASRAPIDAVGTLWLAGSLGAYALAMTLGRGHFGPLNLGLLGTAAGGAAAFARSQARAAVPLIRPEALRTPGLRRSLVLSLMVAAVVMATLVVGPFYLRRALHLDVVRAGLALSVGPLAAALMGLPAGRLVDRYRPAPMALAGLGGMAAGTLLLAILREGTGLPGYLAPLAVTTGSYALFQTANTTAVAESLPAGARGALSGLLGLSRNLGLITGASLLGAVFAAGAGGGEVALASSAAVALGLRATFAAATVVVAVALILAAGRPGLPVEAAPAEG